MTTTTGAADAVVVAGGSESGGDRPTTSSGGKSRGKKKGGTIKRGGCGVSSQDLAMALSSLGRVAPPSSSSSPSSSSVSAIDNIWHKTSQITNTSLSPLSLQAQQWQQYYRPPDAFLVAALSLLPRHLNTISPSDLAMVVGGAYYILFLKDTHPSNHNTHTYPTTSTSTPNRPRPPPSPCPRAPLAAPAAHTRRHDPPRCLHARLGAVGGGGGAARPGGTPAGGDGGSVYVDVWRFV